MHLIAPFLAPVLISIAFFVCITIIIVTLSNNRLKKKLIEMGHVDENAIKLLSQSLKLRFNNLKWGLILFFGGLGLVIISLLPDHLQHDSAFPFGLEIIMISIGFLAYFVMVRNKENIH